MTRDSLSTYGVAPEGHGDQVRPPWPDGVVYHGSRLLLVVALAGTITALFPPIGGATLGRFEVGMVLTEAVIAEVPFTIPKSTEELQRERADAAAGVPPTFNYRPEAGDTMVSGSVGSSPDSTRSLRRAIRRPSARICSKRQSVATPQQAVLLIDDTTRGLLSTTSASGVRRYAEMGIVDATEARELSVESVLIQDPGRRTAARCRVETF